MLNKRNTNLQHQQGANQPYGETAHYLAQRMVLEDDPRRTQHACDEDEYAQPTHRIVSEQGAESNQSAYYGAGSCHVFAELPLQVDNNADYHHDESGKNNSCHIPGDIQPVHHEQAEDVRGNGQDERYIPSFPLCQIAGAKSVDLTEKEDGQGRHKDCKAVHHSQYD